MKVKEERFGEREKMRKERRSGGEGRVERTAGREEVVMKQRGKEGRKK